MIIVNGQQMSEEQFARMQEQAEQQRINQYNRYREFFNCNNAVITPTQRGYGVVCSLDKAVISQGQLVKGLCEGCKAFNDTDYTNI